MGRHLAVAGASFLLAAVAQAAGRVETIDARIVAGEVLSISAKQVVLRSAKGEQTFPRDEVVEIVLAAVEDVMTKAGRAAVVTAAGDVLAAGELALKEGRLRFVSPLVGRAELPLEVVRVIYLPAATQAGRDVERRYRRMKLPDATTDRLVVARKGKDDLAVEGVLESIDARRVSVQWRGKSRQIDRSSVRMIRLAAASAPKPTTRRGEIIGRCGSLLHFASVALAGGALSFQSPTIGARKVAVARAAAVRFRPDSVVNLADLKPAAVREYGFFDTTFHYRADRSVAGRDLQLGGRTFRTGLGLHSFCELSYKLDKRYSALVAVVGIDDAVRPNGDATLAFLGDGKELAKPLHLTGRTDPKPVRLKLAGVTTLTIRVDFGADGLDFSDHVDLAAARLIKQAP